LKFEVEVGLLVYQLIGQFGYMGIPYFLVKKY